MRVLTETYPADAKPTRDGWFLSRPRGAVVFSLTRFMAAGGWIAMDGQPFFEQDREWVGLAFDPDSAEPFIKRTVSIDYQMVTVARGVFLPEAACDG